MNTRKEKIFLIKNLKNRGFYTWFFLLTLFSSSCNEINNSNIIGLKLFYDATNQDVADYEHWYGELYIKSSTSLDSIKNPAIYLKNEGDSSLLKNLFYYHSQFEATNTENVYRITFLTNELYSTLPEYFEANAKMIRNSKLLVQNLDSTFKILPIKNLEVKYYINGNEIEFDNIN